MLTAPIKHENLRVLVHPGADDRSTARLNQRNETTQAERDHMRQRALREEEKRKCVAVPEPVVTSVSPETVARVKRVLSRRESEEQYISQSHCPAIEWSPSRAWHEGEAGYSQTSGAAKRAMRRNAAAA